MAQATQNPHIIYSMPNNGGLYYLRGELKDIRVTLSRTGNWRNRYGSYDQYVFGTITNMGLFPRIFNNDPRHIIVDIPPGPVLQLRWYTRNATNVGNIWMVFHKKHNKGISDIGNLHVYGLEPEEFNNLNIVLEKV